MCDDWGWKPLWLKTPKRPARLTSNLGVALMGKWLAEAVPALLPLFLHEPSPGFFLLRGCQGLGVARAV